MVAPSVFSFTSQQFVDFVFAKLGKGRRHALLLYKSAMRRLPLQGIEPQSEKLVEEIRSLCDWSLPEISKQVEEDNVKKFLLRFEDGLESESVLIPMKLKTTLCVSSQIGCKVACRFCETGKMGKIRSLRAEEIIAQWLVACSLGPVPSNIVFMGMGEPLDNLDELLVALAILTDPQGIDLAPSRITVSTAGLVDALHQFILRAPRGVQLAVSVNAPCDEIRNAIMPINRKWNMQALYKAMAEYCSRYDHTVLVEYVMLNGINDEKEHALRLADYLRGLKTKVNLISYNSQSNATYHAPQSEKIDIFAKTLRESGYQVLLRKNKGNALMAACGQLGNSELRLRVR